MPEEDVDGTEARADRGGDGRFDGDAVGFDRFDGAFGQGCAFGLHDIDTGGLDVPFDLSAGGVDTTAGGLSEFGACAVAGDECYAFGHFFAPV